MLRIPSIFFVLLCVLSCGEQGQSDNVTDSADTTNTIVAAHYSLKPDEIAVLHATLVSAEDTLALIKSSAHEICRDAMYQLNACATVMVRPAELHAIGNYAGQCFLLWRKDYSNNGLLIFLGTDSSGGMWTIEITEADASQYVFAHLCCRKNGNTVKRRSLLDSDLDCGAEPTSKQMVVPFRKRVGIYAEEFHLDQLVMDSNRVSVAETGEHRTGNGQYSEELKLTVKSAEGKPMYWFFEEKLSMCWSGYQWKVRTNTVRPDDEDDE